VLPGVQALLGFQLASVISQSFERLPASSKTVHAASLGCIAVAVILLIAPAAYHRIVFSGQDTEEVHRFGSWLVTCATAPLALGLSGDIYVVLTEITASAMIGAFTASFTLVFSSGPLAPLPGRHPGAAAAALRPTRAAEVTSGNRRSQAEPPRGARAAESDRSWMISPSARTSIVLHGSMYEVGEPISENAGDEQSSQRLFRRIPAQIPSGPSALLIDRSRRLTGLAPHLASDTLNSIPGLRNRLITGCRHLAHQGSGRSQCFSNACLKTLEHSFALIELPFCRVADLCHRIGHDILNSRGRRHRCRCRCRGWGRRRGAERGDGGKELAAMADRGHADGDQVVGRQVRQDVSIDFVVAKRRLVLSKTELLQPTRHIDRHLRSPS